MPTQEKKNKNQITPQNPRTTTSHDMPNKSTKSDKTRDMSHKRPSEIELPLRDETTHHDKQKKTRPSGMRTR